MSHSSSSSTQDPPSPPTPSDSYVEPLSKDKTIQSIIPDLDVSHVSENDQPPLRVVPHSSPQREPAPDSLRPSNSDSVPTNGPLDTTWVKSQPSDPVTPASPNVPTPSPPSGTEPALTSVPRTGADDATSDHTSRISAAMSDGAADIGLSMLQDFLAGNVDDDEDSVNEDEGEDEDDRSERTSLEDTVDGFPAPPTQIPTSSRATSLVLDTVRPPSTLSEYSEDGDGDGDGASFYDNYRYSRQSSVHALAAVPPPIPTDLPPSVRHSLESHLSMPTSPLANDSMPPSPPSQGTPLPTARLPTRNVPPPLTLGSKSSHAAGPSFSSIMTASPLLHTGFASPLSSPPMGSSTTASRSPLSPVFDFRGGGAASALRQRIESERTGSSPLSSPLPSANSQERTFEQSQCIVVADTEEERVPSPRVPSPRGLQPQMPTSPTVSTTSSTSEKKRGGPLPLVVMNQAPPPPYTPTSPLTPVPVASPTYSPMPMPMPSPVILRAHPQSAAEPGPSQSRTSLFLPHPNAPKPSVSSQGALYWRTMPHVPPSPSNGLVQTLRRAATQMRVGPNGRPQFSTLYGSTAHDLLTSAGPVLIYFSTDPPNDVPANRMRMANTPSPPAPIPASPKGIPPSQGGLRPPADRHASTTNPNAIPRTNFIPQAVTTRPRSRSFSGFDSPTNPAAQQKEKRFV